METSRYAQTCTIKQTSSGKVVEAVVQDFKEKNKLIVIVEKCIKLPMTWNGRVYEGKMAGMEFTSDGPKITKYTVGIRG